MGHTADALPVNPRRLNQLFLAMAALLLAGNVLFACGGKPGHGVGGSDLDQSFGAGPGWPSGDGGGGSSGGGDGGGK